MYTLYASKNTYSMSAHLMLQELNVDYQIKWFDIRNKQAHPDEFSAVNPNLTVPALMTGDGPITESGAILVYLAEKHGGRFIPALSDSIRGQFWQWQFYLMSTLQPEVINQFHPERYLPNHPEGHKNLIHSSMLKIEQIWQFIENRLRSTSDFLCNTYCVCDMLFAMQALWVESRPAKISHYPAILKNLSAIYMRPAAKKVLREHEVEHLAQSIINQSSRIDT